MYVVFLETHKMYLQYVIDEGCDHWTHSTREALIFFKRKDIPIRFSNKNKVKIIKDSTRYRFFAGQKQTINKVSKDTKIPVRILYDYCKSFKCVGDMPSRMERKLADYFDYEQGKFHDTIVEYQEKRKRR